MQADTLTRPYSGDWPYAGMAVSVTAKRLKASSRRRWLDKEVICLVVLFLLKQIKRGGNAWCVPSPLGIGRPSGNTGQGIGLSIHTLMSPSVCPFPLGGVWVLVSRSLCRHPLGWGKCCSALHVPLQRAASVIAACCVGHRTVVHRQERDIPFSGSGGPAAVSTPVEAAEPVAGPSAY